MRWLAVGALFAGCGDPHDESSTDPGPPAAPAAQTVVSVPPRGSTGPADDGGGSAAVPRHTTGSGSGAAAEPAPSTATAAAAAAADSTLAPAYVDVDVAPGLGTDGFVGGRDDVELERCELAGDHWVAAGTATNSTGAGAAYRIYVPFNPPDAVAARALVQVDLLIPDGEVRTWEAIAWITDAGLGCVLRVERISG